MLISYEVILSEAELAQTTENIEVAAVAVDETGIRRVVTCLRRSACGLIGVMKDVLDMVVIRTLLVNICILVFILLLTLVMFSLSNARKHSSGSYKPTTSTSATTAAIAVSYSTTFDSEPKVFQDYHL